ncbi:MAG: hypothetical protein JKY08_10335 [Flavobacteriaceae bacterium]|nr:hypothetical protein [Flavobacteriaceae bacterium]
MKHIIRCSLLFLFIGSNCTLFSQVKKYSAVNKIERTTYNLLEDAASKRKQKKDKNLKIVYSDRAKNNVYLDPYALKKGEQQAFLTPYYVINEKNNFVEVVKLDASLLGKPKGLLSPVYSGKYTFKTAKSVQYVGWIQKDKLLLFSHPKISEYNYRPLRYMLGMSELNTLFNLRKYLDKESVYLYESPKLKNKISKSLVLHQFVYLYKYNEAKTAALVSNLKNMHASDSSKQVMGWVPAAMLRYIGQQQVMDIRKTDSLRFSAKIDTLRESIKNDDIASEFLYVNLNHKKDVLTDNASLNVTVPLNVGNNFDNKLINVEGNNLLIRKIKKINKENRIINFHYIFDCSPDLKSQQLQLISSLQRIWVQISENEIYNGYEINFSASSYGCNTFYNFPLSNSFTAWVDYIHEAVSNPPSMEPKNTGGHGIMKCLDFSLSGLQPHSFTNNMIMIVGAKKFKNLNDLERISEKLALTSSRLIFYQLENNSNKDYQDYILQSKRILSSVGEKFASFMKGYTVENRLVKKEHIFAKIPAKDNMYIYDAPENSVSQGGLVFPKINELLDPTSFDMALDTVLSKTIRFNKMMVNSLEVNADKLGFFGAKLGDRIHQIIENDTVFNQKTVPKLALKTRYVENRNFISKENNASVQGFLLSASELETLIDAYRSLSPKISKALKRKDRNFIFRLYKSNVHGINDMILKNELDTDSSLSELFFLKTGFPVGIQCFDDISVADLRSKRRVPNDMFLDIMNYLRFKTEDLESILEQGKGVEVKGESSNYYFISVKKII